MLNALEEGAGLELLIDKIRTTKTNDEFLTEIAKAPLRRLSGSADVDRRPLARRPASVDS